MTSNMQTRTMRASKALATQGLEEARETHNTLEGRVDATMEVKINSQPLKVILGLASKSIKDSLPLKEKIEFIT